STTCDAIEHEDGILRDMIMKLSMACIEHDIWNSSFESPLLHYLAVLGIDQLNASYHNAGSYTGYLASILYCARLLMIKSCTILSGLSLLSDSRLSPSQIFQQQKAKYMTCSQET